MKGGGTAIAIWSRYLGCLFNCKRKPEQDGDAPCEPVYGLELECLVDNAVFYRLPKGSSAIVVVRQDGDAKVLGGEASDLTSKPLRE
jgi:hypothetical protein